LSHMALSKQSPTEPIGPINRAYARARLTATLTATATQISERSTIGTELSLETGAATPGNQRARIAPLRPVRPLRRSLNRFPIRAEEGNRTWPGVFGCASARCYK